ncbi:MAG TPA: LemA family protein [Candidatus Paceibacterota bacterium]|nr:LemA family protein [Candidatus Paceibacterota bacterium]
MKRSTIIIIVVVVLILGYIGVSYNGLVTASASADAQWAQVETQYQRRFDLIPNLVNAVKGAMKQEQAVFDAIADARTRYSGAATASDKAEAASEVESAYARLLVVMENYPTLKSSENVMTLQAQIEGTENRISVERGRYNDAVRDYNLRVARFPSSLVAGTFGFGAKAYFQSAAGADTAPTVEF